ncbi:DUF6236 family protein [Acinetobacter baumannii]|uniref:DUF6236 family protein n=1 Tax=Acinetobacter baumannii TaxID=470 RepID=UPI000DE75E42|nr:DUF6236 family protein [Acinetobacter baumannii]EKV6547521.1 hypothetical protein [Acinetobacter baumannii]ELB0410220.1 hypothetical protein [Acinetobacter baumannii]ELQ4939704.1 hypothetical protein [Acinetobacter baumannii]EMD2134935.1 hypothetical protein [Acinetobacter baumannii]MBH8246803.1 hypothetical protein [Acinetobacter baumannii]
MSKNIIRGVVTPPGQVSIRGNQYNMVRSYSNEDLLYYALYWDKIVMPSGIVKITSELADELIKSNVLSQPGTFDIQPHPSTVNQDGMVSMERHELYAFGEIAKSKLNTKGENWVISHIDGDPIYLPTHTNKENSLRLRVTQILPFPAMTGDYSVDDLLNFKIRRESELAALHDSMDNLLKKLYNEPIQAIRETEIKRFENAVSELDKTLIERFRVIQKSDWEVGLSLDPVNILERTSAIGAAIAADHALSPFPIFTSIAGLASVLSLSKKYGVTFNQYARDDIKLEYISGAKSEKIIP